MKILYIALVLLLFGSTGHGKSEPNYTESQFLKDLKSGRESDEIFEDIHSSSNAYIYGTIEGLGAIVFIENDKVEYIISYDKGGNILKVFRATKENNQLLDSELIWENPQESQNRKDANKSFHTTPASLRDTSVV